MINYIYKEYMQWINQVQLFRIELADIRSEIVTDNPVKDVNKAGLILAKVEEINKELETTEHTILTDLNREKLIWGGKYNHFNRYNDDKPERLLERMKRHFNEMLTLQQTVVDFLTVNILNDDDDRNERREKNRRGSNGVQRFVPVLETGVL
jgi:hypothetical protein